MSKLWVSDEVKHLHRYYAEHRHVGEEVERWYVCPACFWIGVTLVAKNPSCPRPVQDFVGQISAKSFNADTCEAKMVWIDTIAPRVADAMSTAMRLGGSNAVIKLVDNLEPIEIGLDDPGGRTHFFDFAGLRPGSAKTDYAGWWATSDPSGNTMVARDMLHAERKRK